MKSGIIYTSFSFFSKYSFCPFEENSSYRTRFLYFALGINGCQVFISTINIKKAGGGGWVGGRSWQIFRSKIPEPKPLVSWFLLLGSVYLIHLSQRLAYRVACSIVVVSLEVRTLVFLHYLCYINNN